MTSLPEIARALGGEVCGGQILAPGPGHSPKDRSLSLKPIVDAPDGFVVHSFAGDDPIACRDYVREKLGLEHRRRASFGAPSETLRGSPCPSRTATIPTTLGGLPTPRISGTKPSTLRARSRRDISHTVSSSCRRE